MTTIEARITEALLAHWAHNCSPDRCTCSCGESIKHWGDGVDANQALAAHQAAVVAGIVADACAEAYELGRDHEFARSVMKQEIPDNPYRKDAQ